MVKLKAIALQSTSSPAHLALFSDALYSKIAFNFKATMTIRQLQDSNRRVLK